MTRQVSGSPAFPGGFLWGTATAAHQVEGGNQNDWTAWEEAGGSKDRSGRACDHWDIDRFRSDVALMKDLGMNAYRLSVEWSRVMPRPGEIDRAALGRYRLMLEILKAEGLTVMVTLHHFTNPCWFVAQGGWERASYVPFLAYVRAVADALGDRVDLWATFNEPIGYAILGWVVGIWPPGRKHSLLGAFRVARRMASAHDDTYRLLKAATSAPVGVVHSMIRYEPFTRSATDRLLSWIANYGGNLWFLRATVNDFIGMNYYMRERLHVPSVIPFRVRRADPEHATSDFGWEIYPKGIHDLLLSLRRFRVPVYVTENGLADAADSRRADFIREHLRWVRRAMDAGVDVRGYFHWSLVDNFEWAEGYTKKFGLVEVDFSTQERRPRPSAYAYRDIARANAVDD
ncbi:MAG: hypothetical protein RL272_681 [Candidatus Parcubacteria bacterium]